MRVLLFLNNWGAWQIARWLRQRRENIVGLFLQPPNDRRFADEILDALKLPAEQVWTSNQLRDPETVAKLRELRPDIGISAFFGCILKPEVLQIFPHGCINLHPALLPYNRGWHTNVWPIIEGTPAGVTIHYIDPGVDTGDITAQRRITVEPTETGGSLHEKTIRAEVDLFKETWPLIREGKNSRTAQDHSKAIGHKKAELAEISRIDLERTYRASDLINLLRARTYPPYPSAYYVENEKRIYVRIELLREDQLAAFGIAGSAKKVLPRGDLEAEYRAKDLLDLLGIHDSNPKHFVEFQHESGPLFARGYIADERDFDTAASPSWMNEPASLSAAAR
jgi:methionyl-tRNA formyltransferase